MNNVIGVDFTPKKENSEYEINDKQLRAVRNHGLNLCVGSMTLNTFMVSMQGQSEVISRDELSEFLWMAAYMLDSEQRWCPKEMPAINY